MAAESGPRANHVLIAAALFCMWGGGALSQQSGTVLRESLTLLGSTAPTMEIDVAGPKTANTETDLLLEFGPDGNSSSNPVPDPHLAATTTFTVSASFGGSRSFMPPGGTETQVFADKIVAFGPRDPANAPGLYALSIIHLKDIPAGVTETWKVLISDLPSTGLRAVASVRQGTFRSLLPTGISQGPPTISLQPPPFAAGSMSALTVRSSAGLDLSHLALAQVTITPTDGIAILGVDNATPNSAVISFSIAKCAAGGERTLTIRDLEVSASTVFAIAAQQGSSTISVVPNGVITFSSATLNVASFGCLDLTGLTPAQVIISPGDGISGITVAAISATSANISFEVAENAQLGKHTLSIIKGGANAADSFGVIRHAPPHQGGACEAGQKCCGQTSGGSCSGECIPRNRTCQ